MIVSTSVPPSESEANINELTRRMTPPRVPGVWGSAFSILFNRVLGVKDTAGGSTMEEELGKICHHHLWLIKNVHVTSITVIVFMHQNEYY